MAQGARTFSSIVTRGWPIIVIAALAGAVAAPLTTGGATGEQFVASQRVTIAGVAAGPQNPPGPDDLVAAATLANVRRSAAASLGVDASALAGTVAAKNDPGDRRSVIFTARATSEADARKRAEAMARAAVSYILERYDVYIAVQQDTISRMSERADLLEARERELLERARAARGAERAAFEQALIANRGQLFNALDAVANARNAIEQVRRSMVLGESTVVRSSTGGVALSAILQGALLGAVIGAALAAIRERYRAGARAGA